MTPPRVRRAAWFAGIAIVAGLACLIVYGFFVRTTLGQELDEAAFTGAEHEPTELIDGAFDFLDVISVASLAVATVAIGTIGLVRGRVGMAVAAVGTIGAANALTQLLKRTLLERPDLIGAGDANSLPSGHTTVAATVAIGLVMVVAPRWRAPVALLAGLFPVAVGVGVVTVSAHRPSDVLAALSVTVAVAAALIAIAILVRGYDLADEPPGWFIVSSGGAMALVVGVLSVIAAGGLFYIRNELGYDDVGSRDEVIAFVAAAAGITAATVVAMAAIVVPLRGIDVGHRVTAERQGSTLA